jgi:hypothetical protein
MYMPSATAPTKIEAEAMQLFAVKTADAVRNVLWSLGLREPCSRCLGSGHYSRNSFGSTTCYKCNGRKTFAAKLTRKVLDAARAKVLAGELDELRRQAQVRAEARKAVAQKIAAAKIVYGEIADAYTAGSRAVDSIPSELRQEALSAFVDGPLFRAQGLNNTLFYGDWSTGRPGTSRALTGMHDIKNAVEHDGLDPVVACAMLDDRAAMLAELRDAWRAQEHELRSGLRSAAHRRLAA